MAQTIDEIYQGLLTEKEYHPELYPLNSTSKVSIWRLLLYLFAVGSWALQNVVELAQSAMTLFVQQQKIHSLSWYSDFGKRFQYGYELPWGEVYYNNTGIDEDTVAASQLVKFCSVTKVPGGLRVAIAGLDGDDLAPVPSAPFTAFQEYFFRITAAGDNVMDFVNTTPDKLFLGLVVYYDPLVLDDTGKRLDGTNDTPIQDAVNSYIKSIDFNSRFIPTFLTDAIQKVEGVKVPVIDNCETQYASLPSVQVPNNGVVPHAGYVRLNDPSDLYIIFIKWQQ